MFHISCNQLSYSFADGTSLFEDLTFAWSGQRLGIVGDNGCGKSTLFSILSGKVPSGGGSLDLGGAFALLEQIPEERSGQSVLEVLGIAEKVLALQRILDGEGNESDLLTLDDDWEIGDRLERLFTEWNLSHIDPLRKFSSLSGGERNRLSLAALSFQPVDAFLLDEPSNHLDRESRQALFEWMDRSSQAFVVISHDREVLGRMDHILELSTGGARLFGGNFDEYQAEKKAEAKRLEERYESSLKDLRKARKQEIQNKEKQQKRNVRGAKRNKAAGVPKEVLNKLKGEGEATMAKVKKMQSGRVSQKETAMREARKARNYQYDWKIDADTTAIPSGKILLKAQDLNFAWAEAEPLWAENLDFQLNGGQRLLIEGPNGSGKSTLLKLITGDLEPVSGNIRLNTDQLFKLDQHLDFLNPRESVMENFQRHFQKNLAEHEQRIRLGRFRFEGEEVFKPMGQLSGGERMRLALACLLATDQRPDLLLLDEPTNHLDLRSREIFAGFLSSYPGAMLLVTHDAWLVEELEVKRELNLGDFLKKEAITDEEE